LRERPASSGAGFLFAFPQIVSRKAAKESKGAKNYFAPFVFYFAALRAPYISSL
jgi:hypothetical protein